MLRLYILGMIATTLSACHLPISYAPTVSDAVTVSVASEVNSIPYPEPSTQEQQELIYQLMIKQNKQQQQINYLEERIKKLERTLAYITKTSTKNHKSMPFNKSVQEDSALVAQLQQAKELFKQKKYQQVIQTLQNTDGGGDGKETARESMLLLIKSHQNLGNCQSVINIGQRYANRFASSLSSSEVLFNVGQCQWQIQQQDIARETWRQVIRKYPSSLAAHRASKQINQK